jgi:hypothetical protein
MQIEVNGDHSKFEGNVARMVGVVRLLPYQAPSIS